MEGRTNRKAVRNQDGNELDGFELYQILEASEAMTSINDLSEAQHNSRAQIARKITKKFGEDEEEKGSQVTEEESKIEQDDAYVDDIHELRLYISDLLLIISTGDEEADMANIEMVADNVHAKTVQVQEEQKKLLELTTEEIRKKLQSENYNQEEAKLLME